MSNSSNSTAGQLSFRPGTVRTSGWSVSAGVGPIAGTRGGPETVLKLGGDPKNVNDELKGGLALFAVLFIWLVPFLFSFFKTTRKLWLESERKISLRELRAHTFIFFGLGRGWSRPHERIALGTSDDDLVYACRAKIYQSRWIWGLLGFVVYIIILRIL
jgi:hypothetical protein